METANDILLKALGALLIIAGALKGWQLMTEPVANNSILTWRPFMVLQVDKDWFVTTPAVALLTDGNITSAWEEKAPDLDTIFKLMSKRDDQGNHWTSTGRGFSGNDNYSKVYR